MKGLSVPINVIVILIVVLLVLLAVAAFFAGGFGGGTSTMSDTAALQKGCGMWMSRGCKTDQLSSINVLGYDANKDGNANDALQTACNNVLGAGSDCWAYCCGGLNPTGTYNAFTTTT